METDEFDAVYAGSFSRLVDQIRAMTGTDFEEASDCVQEAFIRLWSSHETTGHVASPEAWVRVTAYRLAVSRWRRLVRARRPGDRALSPERVSRGPDETRVAVQSALNQLPREQRRALVLFHLCDLTVAQISAEVGAPQGTVKARLSRGRQTLHQLLSVDEELPKDGAFRV